MIQNSNLRFTYQQKAQYLSSQHFSATEKPQVGKLVFNYRRAKPVDEQQEQLVTKKSTVLNNDSMKNSKLFSEPKFTRADKLPSRRNSQLQKYSFNQELANNETRQEKIYSSGALEPIKQLPLIVKNSRGSRHSETPKLAQNQSHFEIRGLNDEKNNPIKGKSFSISSYDIYKPGFFVSRQQLAASRKKEFSRQERFEQNTNMNKSLYQGLEQEKPQPALQINFENSTDRDLPESKEIESSINNSKIYPKEDIEIVEDYIKPNKNVKQIQLHETDQKEKDSKIKQTAINNQDKEYQTSTKQIFDKKVKEAPQKTQIKAIEIIKTPEQPSKTAVNQMKELKLSQIKEKKEQPKVNQVSVCEEKNEDHLLSNKMNSQKNQPKKNLEVDKQKNQDNRDVQKHIEEQDTQVYLIKIDKEKEEKIKMIENIQRKPDSNQIQEKKPDPRQTEKKIESYRLFEAYKFSIQDYTNIYAILKEVQTCLKAPVLDSHFLLKHIKTYLEIIAGGSLDHIESYSMPLHKLKIIKNALLYERIAIVTISFAYAVGKIKECLKYLINLISYASNNTLLILKILEGCQIEADPSKNPIIAKSDRLIMKRNFDTVRNSNDIILDSIFKISKVQEAFFESFKDIIKSVGKNSLERTFYNVLQYFSFFLCVSGLHMTIPFLAVAPNPYLKQTIDKKPTLVIDIVEIFCHGTRKSKSHIFRPHTQYFLSEMSQYYELISFTCAYPNQIDKVIDILDPKNHIKHRLYRHHALTRQNLIFKDLERLGRDIHKMILLDSEANVIEGESLNTIKIPVWRGNKNDTILAELCPILATIAVKDMDCLESVKKINEQQQKNEEAGIKYLNFGISLE